MGKFAHPDRRPAVVTGASSGHRRRDRAGARRAGHPVALGARRVDKLRRAGDPDPRGRRRGRPSTRSTSPTASRSRRSPRRSPPTSATSRSSSATPGSCSPARTYEVDDRAVRAASSTSTSSAPTGWCARSCRAWSSGSAATSSSSPRDVAVRARPFMSSYAAGKWGLEGMAHALQMELEGTGVRASIVRPGPDLERDGLRLGRRRGGVRAQPVGPVRPGPAPALPQGDRARRRDHHDRHARRAAST